LKATGLTVRVQNELAFISCVPQLLPSFPRCSGRFIISRGRRPLNLLGGGSPPPLRTAHGPRLLVPHVARNCLFGDMAYRSHVIAWAPQVSVTEHEIERGMLAEHDNPSCPFEYPDNTGGGLRGWRSASGQRFSAPSGDDTSRGASASCAPSWSTRQRQRAFPWSLWTRGTHPAPVPRAGQWTRRTDRRGTSSDACRAAHRSGE
jgi:hypothetical protein